MRRRNLPRDDRRRRPRSRSPKAAVSAGWEGIERSKPHLLPTVLEDDGVWGLKLRAARNPLARSTLGDFGVAVRLNGPEHFTEAILVHPVARSELVGIDARSVRLFRADAEANTLRPVWNSGFNEQLGFVWARVRRSGVYVALGLPRDRLVQEAIRRLAVERRLHDAADDAEATAVTESAFAPLLEIPDEALGELREYLARIEIQNSVGGLRPAEVEMGTGGHPGGFLLPGGLTFEEFRKRRLERLVVPQGGLPEEALFFPPHIPRNGEPPWDSPGGREPWRGVDWRTLDHLKVWRLDPSIVYWLLPPWLFSRDWWMHQHDVRHTGHASGASDITGSTVSNLYLHATASVDGPIVTKPSIVGGKVYFGSGKDGGVGGTLYRIDLATGAIENSLTTTGTAFYSWVSGIGGSPAVVGNRIYFTGVHGTVYCIDKNTFAPIWSVSLKTADLAHNQPVTNPNADCWSGPLVVNNKVFVGCGEGESASTYGFVFCLDASTGDVIWCFCTCKFTGGADNQPNHLPTAVAAPWAAAHGFTVQANPPETGCSVWSSCAYDRVYNRIFVGTGNSQYPHTAQPDELYGSGLISLDADSGAFQGFFQPTPDDSYWPDDSDIDVPGAPSVYSIGAQRVVAFGSKNGSFFVLDAGNVNNVIARRQLLPRAGGSGLPGDRGTGLASVVPGGGGENSFGVFGTPAIHFGLRRLFVGLGGYNGMALDAGAGIDQTRTPFLRALNWDDLHDAWPTALGADNVSRYTNTKPPMYSSLEVGLSSPAVVGDVVFVATSPPPFSGDSPGLYALSTNDGHCLWSAGGLATTGGTFALGPAVYGNYVVVGAGKTVFIYRLGPCWRFPPIYRKPWPWEMVEHVPVGPDPPPDPWLGPDPFPDPVPGTEIGPQGAT
jgi:outer membrane protein assembly factor BamB